jgi:predicted O-methyltransferase YrrM
MRDEQRISIVFRSPIRREFTSVCGAARRGSAAWMRKGKREEGKVTSADFDEVEVADSHHVLCRAILARCTPFRG